MRELYPSSARCKSAMAEIVFPFSIESPAFFPQTPPRRLFVLCRRGHGRCGCGGHHLAVPVHPGLDMGRYGQILTGGGGWAAPGPGMRPALRMGMTGMTTLVLGAYHEISPAVSNLHGFTRLSARTRGCPRAGPGTLPSSEPRELGRRRHPNRCHGVRGLEIPTLSDSLPSRPWKERPLPFSPLLLALFSMALS